MDRDEQLIKRMQKGDDEAFDLFVHKYYESILRYCAYHVSGSEDAKDLTQDTFLRFFSGFSNYAHTGKAKNYLYTIAGNLCKNYYRKNSGLISEVLDEEKHQDSIHEDIDSVMNVRMCLNILQEEYREVLILFYYQGLKQMEIATILGIGLPLVKYRLKREKNRWEGFWERRNYKWI